MGETRGDGVWRRGLLSNDKLDGISKGSGTGKHKAQRMMVNGLD